MSSHTFLAGEHDQFVCGHVCSRFRPSGPVEHTEQPDGSMTVEFPGLTEQNIFAALSTYSREEYENRTEPKKFDVKRAMLMKRIRALEEGA